MTHTSTFHAPAALAGRLPALAGQPRAWLLLFLLLVLPCLCSFLPEPRGSASGPGGHAFIAVRTAAH
jgi:hypothetical protein